VNQTVQIERDLTRENEETLERVVRNMRQKEEDEETEGGR